MRRFSGPGDPLRRVLDGWFVVDPSGHLYQTVDDISDGTK